MNMHDIADAARRAVPASARLSPKAKNRVLEGMAGRLSGRRADVLAANQRDLERARSEGLKPAIVKRLRFGEQKIESRIRSLHKIAALPDPVGQSYRMSRRENGLQVARVRVPLGVILMIYEARPHVTVNAGAFCLKSGNVAILRGGSEARECNRLLGTLWEESLQEVGLAPETIQVIGGSHEEVDELLELDELIDLVIPRGGKNLIRSVQERSRIPVLKHASGICHLYLDHPGDVSRGLRVALDSKCLMPEVCNAMETLLVHEALVPSMADIVQAFRAQGVEVRGCERTRAHVPDVALATDEDWRTEYLDLIVSVRVVRGVDEAVDHINTFGSHHTDAIMTDSLPAAEQFVEEVDSGVVLVNASTMFCDGESLGMGAEIGISTDKLHARGPVGLEELTSYKHVVRGDATTMGRWSS